MISLLVPFRGDSAERSAVWEWLESYWKHELPDAEIVMGRDHHCEGRSRRHVPFSKSAAVNDAFGRAKGDVVVILDADTYLAGSVIQHCADRIRAARTSAVPMWFIPYRTIYRLTEEATEEVLESDPENPLRFSSPPSPEVIEGTTGTSFGHKYGALIQILPREAFVLVGGMDPRFRGWGGEDVCFLRAVDTLWGKHKNVPNDVLHLWHPNLYMGAAPVVNVWKSRVWLGQTATGANDRLSVRYDRATNKPVVMRALCKEGEHHRGR